MRLIIIGSDEALSETTVRDDLRDQILRGSGLCADEILKKYRYRSAA